MFLEPLVFILKNNTFFRDFTISCLMKPFHLQRYKSQPNGSVAGGENFYSLTHLSISLVILNCTPTLSQKASLLLSSLTLPRLSLDIETCDIGVGNFKLVTPEVRSIL
jgi:hypothetical protein